MFPLVLTKIGRFFNLPAARAAIESKIQPAIQSSLSAMTKPQWVQTVSDYLRQNSTSVVTVLSSLSLVTDVVQILSEDAKPEDAVELDEIRKLVGQSASAPIKVGSCTANPELLAEKVKKARDMIDEARAPLMMTRKEFIAWYPVFAQIAPEDVVLAGI